MKNPQIINKNIVDHRLAHLSDLKNQFLEHINRERFFTLGIAILSTKKQMHQELAKGHCSVELFNYWATGYNALRRELVITGKIWAPKLGRPPKMTIL